MFFSLEVFLQVHQGFVEALLTLLHLDYLLAQLFLQTADLFLERPQVFFEGSDHLTVFYIFLGFCVHAFLLDLALLLQFARAFYQVFYAFLELFLYCFFFFRPIVLFFSDVLFK